MRGVTQPPAAASLTPRDVDLCPPPRTSSGRGCSTSAARPPWSGSCTATRWRAGAVPFTSSCNWGSPPPQTRATKAHECPGLVPPGPPRGTSFVHPRLSPRATEAHGLVQLRLPSRAARAFPACPGLARPASPASFAAPLSWAWTCVVRSFRVLRASLTLSYSGGGWRQDAHCPNRTRWSTATWKPCWSDIRSNIAVSAASPISCSAPQVRQTRWWCGSDFFIS